MQGNDPFFSIIIPTYNRAKFITKTLDSLLTNIYKNYEIIVVDDGSTDNTADVVKPYLTSNVHYFKKDNAERGAARNYGMHRSKGEYINFFDSDDICLPNHLEEASKFLLSRSEEIKVFHLGYNIVDPFGNIIRVSNLPAIVNDRLLDGNHLSCNGVFLRKDVVQKDQFSEERELSASEDYELWLRLASLYDIHNVNVVTTSVVDHEGRSVFEVNIDKIETRINLLSKKVLANSNFHRRFKGFERIFKAHLQLYLALHASMAKVEKLKVFKLIYTAVKFDTNVMLTRKFFGVLKNVLFR